MDSYSHLQMTRTIGKDGVAEEEYNFSAEVKLGAQDPIWKEKYRPRKPRFFNRVHTVSLEGQWQCSPQAKLMGNVVE